MELISEEKVSDFSGTCRMEEKQNLRERVGSM
jgi:hypothetical protein